MYYVSAQGVDDKCTLLLLVYDSAGKRGLECVRQLTGVPKTSEHSLALA